MMFYPEHIMYTLVQPEDVNEIFESHIKNGKLCDRGFWPETRRPKRSKTRSKMSTFSPGRSVSHCRNCGTINPENIDEYIARDGYLALEKVLTEMEPEDVIDTIKDSQLRGQRRRRLPYRCANGALPLLSRSAQKYVMLQRRRRRPGCIHGQIGAGGRPSLSHRSHDHSRICHRSKPGLCLCQS